MTTYLKQARIYVPLLWILVSLTPFLLIGESWGAIWYYINLPSSELLKYPLHNFGIGPFVISATITNAFIIFALVTLVTAIIRKAKGN